MSDTPKALKKVKKHIDRGLIRIKSTFNNTIITITDLNGNVLSTASAGQVGFKHSRKSTPFAAGKAAEKACQKVKSTYGTNEVEIFGIGPGAGFDTAVKTIEDYFKIEALHEVTPLPHNGCKPKKVRRV